MGMITIILIVAIIILFSYFSFVYSIKGKDIDFKTIEGIKTAGQLYFSWLGNSFSNFKTITANAIHLDWKAENTTKES